MVWKDNELICTFRRWANTVNPIKCAHIFAMLCFVVLYHCSLWIYMINSLWPSHSVRWHGSGSTLAQVMAWCLTAPSHYFNQCWLIISEVLCHSLSLEDVKIPINKTNLKIEFLKSHPDLPGANELMHACSSGLLHWHWGNHSIGNYMNPGYFTLAATDLKPQQMHMFPHISARVWGHRWSPHTSEQKGCMLKPQ